MKSPALLSAALLLALSHAAVAEIVAVQWDAGGQFSQAMPVAPGKFVEVCEKLAAGSKVSWSFEASAPVDFNIHYHEGKDVRYPARKAQVTRDEGTLAATPPQTYCWMWSNKGQAALTLQFKLAKG